MQKTSDFLDINANALHAHTFFIAVLDQTKDCLATLPDGVLAAWDWRLFGLAYVN